MRIILIIIILILLYIFGILDIIIFRNYKRYRYYRDARQKSIEKNKKLLVVGCPNTGGISSKIGNIFNVYGCGDLTIDIERCKCNNFEQNDLYEALKTKKDNEYVIFVSVTLEYIKEIEKVIEEIDRVSGGDIYIVNIDIPIERIGINLGRYNKFERYWRIDRKNDKIIYESSKS